MDFSHTISIDVGTTNLKLSRFNQQLQFEKEWIHRYSKIQSDESRYELNWNELRDALLKGIRKLMPETPYRIVLTTAMHSILLRDDKHQDVTEIITWADKRGHKELLQFDNAFKEKLYLETGTPIHSMNPFYKLSYGAKQSYWDSVTKVYSIKDLIFELLTGEWWIDVSNASSYGIYDNKKGQWSERALNSLRLKIEQLPKVKACDSSAPILYNLNLGQGIVVLGTSDGVSSNYAYRSLSNYAVLSFGTSHAVRILTNKNVVSLKSMNFSYKIDETNYLVGFPSNNAGNVLDWICKVYQTNFEELEQIALTGYPLKLVFLPFLNGERAPLWTEGEVSRLIGLERFHTRENILFAMLCGLFYNVRNNVENLQALHHFNGIALTGGLIQSRNLVQLMTNILGMPVLIASENSAECLGTILLVDDLNFPIDYEIVEPDFECHRKFDENYQNYLIELSKINHTR
ncbi:hypothetical protein I4Q36_08635 [Tuanshanicoccus lijuaniae]|uniref:FGGY-family carbohydrate kinase n=1 Tax=Aerococcaceae bacterium zg-1292 TaxID=2774330 RepID=UPI001938FE30|nr:hypothetical protein [Aerococcaceae bacterium zg-1292]QQA36849.1 hypothetical protein I4Q36_08635 [Aerococcaceae bacterium zg-1292]